LGEWEVSDGMMPTLILSAAAAAPDNMPAVAVSASAVNILREIIGIRSSPSSLEFSPRSCIPPHTGQGKSRALRSCFSPLQRLTKPLATPLSPRTFDTREHADDQCGPD